MSQSWNELLTRDHEIIEKVFAATEKALASEDGPPPSLVAKTHEFLRDYADRCHTAKEEKHLFPVMERCGVSRQEGPLGVMLQEHEKAREILSRFGPLAEAFSAGDSSKLDSMRSTFQEYATHCKNHFWKENDILYPMALRVMSEQDGAQVVRGIEQVESAFGPQTRDRYYRLAEEIVAATQLPDLSFGVERDVLAAILNTLPIELSFVDPDDTVRYFSHEHSEKIFGRTRGVIGMRVQNCHPQKSVHVVNQILSDFKAGKSDVAEFWIDLGPRKIHIRYWPVRSRDGSYLGCLETVQDVTTIQKLTGQRRLLDPA